MMFLVVFLTFFLLVFGDIPEPKFQVFTPETLMVEVPSVENKKLLTFRIGVKRRNSEEEDFELGENVIRNNRLFIEDKSLNLQRGDLINYLLVFRDKEGYQARTGSYVFDGGYYLYYKRAFDRRNRFRRDATTEEPEVESRFGLKHYGHHNHQRFDVYGPSRHGPPFFMPGPPNFLPSPFDGYLPPQGGPNWGLNCNDHRHDKCHESPDAERWEKLPGKQGKCCKCKEEKVTTTEIPDIDIRFAE